MIEDFNLLLKLTKVLRSRVILIAGETPQLAQKCVE
jgi:hypothetical protein